MRTQNHTDECPADQPQEQHETAHACMRPTTVNPLTLSDTALDEQF